MLLENNIVRNYEDEVMLYTIFPWVYYTVCYENSI